VATELVRLTRPVGLLKCNWIAIDGLQFQAVSSAKSVHGRRNHTPEGSYKVQKRDAPQRRASLSSYSLRRFRNSLFGLPFSAISSFGTL
jgi:hypothetical protein